MIALAAVTGCQTGRNPAGTAFATSSACPERPAAAANSGPDTLLGVNATNPSQLTIRTAQFGHIPILRVYDTGMPDPSLWTSGVEGLNHSAVVVSFRSPPSTVLSGADDAALARFFDSAPDGYPIYWSYYHEPELLVQAGTFTTAQYKAAWAHIAAIAAAARNPELKATLILMTWDLNPASGINWLDYLPAGHVISVLGWDAYPAGTVHDSNPQPTPPADFMGAAEAASRSVGLPYGFAEFALGTAADRPQWLAQVASYLRSTGALFGTLFDSTGFPWMELTDDSSIQAWHSEVSTSDSEVAAADLAPSSQASSPPSAATPAVSSVSASPAANPLGPAVSQARVDPTAFAPTGQNHVRILFKLGQSANVAVCVLDSHGVVQRELDHANAPAGWSSYWYYGYTTAGKLLPAGTYTIVVAATDSSGTNSAQTTLTIGSGSPA